MAGNSTLLELTKDIIVAMIEHGYIQKQEPNGKKTNEYVVKATEEIFDKLSELNSKPSK